MKDEKLSQNKSKSQDLSERDNLNASTSRKKVGDKTINLSQDDSRIGINPQNDNQDKPPEEGNKDKQDIDYETLYHNKELFDEQYVEQEEWKVYYENSKNYILQAFSKENPVKEEWLKSFVEIAINEEKHFKSIYDFHSYKESKFTNIESVKYSVNTIKEGIEIKGDQIFLFPKFIMLINLIFQITFVYTYQYETGYKVFIQVIQETIHHTSEYNSACLL